MNFSVYRFLMVVMPFSLIGIKAHDVVYNPNPLYHTAGGMVGIGCALLKGIPVVIRNKFSVTSYWTDCIKYNCTVGGLWNLYSLINSCTTAIFISNFWISIRRTEGIRKGIWKEDERYWIKFNNLNSIFYK